LENFLWTALKEEDFAFRDPEFADVQEANRTVDEVQEQQRLEATRILYK